MNPKKVINRFALITTDYKPNIGGGAEWVYQVALCLYRNVEDILVIAPKSGVEANEFDSQQPFKTIRSIPRRGNGLWEKSLSIIQHWSFLKSAWQLSKNREFSYILACETGVYGGYLGFLRWAVLKTCNIPIGIVFHGQDVDVVPRMGRIRRHLLTFIINRADDIFCNSHFTANTAKSAFGLSVSPIVVGCGVCPNTLPPPIEKEDARKQLNLRAHHIILTIGRLVQRKGIDMVIRSLPEILSRFPDFLYLVGGTGYDLARLRRLAKQTGCEEFVRFDGKFENRMTAHYYCAADIFVMPARHIPNESVEGFGIVYAEAGNYGIPVIGGRSGGVPETVIEGQTGLLVNPEDPHEIAESIIMLLQDSTICRQLATCGKSLVHKEFTWNNVVGRILRKVR